MGIGKKNVAADPAVFNRIEHPIDVGALVMDQIEQVGGAAGQVQVDGIAGIDVEFFKGIECVYPLDRRGSHVGNASIDRKAGLGVAVRHDLPGQGHIEIKEL